MLVARHNEANFAMAISLLFLLCVALLILAADSFHGETTDADGGLPGCLPPRSFPVHNLASCNAVYSRRKIK